MLYSQIWLSSSGSSPGHGHCVVLFAMTSWLSQCHSPLWSMYWWILHCKLLGQSDRMLGSNCSVINYKASPAGMGGVTILFTVSCWENPELHVNYVLWDMRQLSRRGLCFSTDLVKRKLGREMGNEEMTKKKNL